MEQGFGKRLQDVGSTIGDIIIGTPTNLCGEGVGKAGTGRMLLIAAMIACLPAAMLVSLPFCCAASVARLFDPWVDGSGQR